MKSNESKTNIISVDNLTKEYNNGNGVFDVSFTVQKGEILGLLGPNGAGKTTIIRHLLGFIKSDSGATYMYGENTRISYPKERVGYLPGETAVPNELTAKSYLNTIAAMRCITDRSKMHSLIERFDLDINMLIRKMSKGNRQKVGIIAAFMHDPDILILDEPTSGLDPFMQKEFINLVLEEKATGKTIIFASHIFDEVEKTCDRICFLQKGKIIKNIAMLDFKNTKIARYFLKFDDASKANEFAKRNKKFNPDVDNDEVLCKINNVELNDFIKSLADTGLVELHELEESFENIYMQVYDSEGAINENV